MFPKSTIKEAFEQKKKHEYISTRVITLRYLLHLYHEKKSVSNLVRVVNPKAIVTVIKRLVACMSVATKPTKLMTSLIISYQSLQFVTNKTDLWSPS